MARYRSDFDEDLETLATLIIYQRKRKLKTKRITSRVNELAQKKLHGQHARLLNQPEINEDAFNRWLKSATLKRATESMVCAIREQAITTKYITTKYIQQKCLDKIRAYTDLAVEVKTLLGLSNVEIAPNIVGATGTIYNGFDESIKKLNLKRVKLDKFQTQMIALLGTAHIVGGFLLIA